MATKNIKTIKPSDGDYSSLSNWEAGEQGDLVTADTIAIADCYSMEDTGSIIIDGWTTGADNYILIRGAASDKTTSNTGKWSTKRYRHVLNTINISTTAIKINEEYVHIDGLQFERSDTVYTMSTVISIETASAANVLISNTIFQRGSGKCGNMIYCSRYYSKVKIWNCTFAHTASSQYAAIGISGSGKAVYNCTFHDCVNAIMVNTNDNTPIVNCLFTNCTTDVYLVSPGSIADTYCATTNDKTKGLTADGTGNRFGQTFTFVDADNHDFHLASNDAGAKDQGTSDPGSGLFSNDIDGKTRSGSWDIGADEYVSGFALPLGDYYFNNMRT